MGKKLTKSEKLDQILSELAKLRVEVKKLVMNQTAVADHGVKTRPRSTPKRPKKVPNQTGTGKKPLRDVAPSKPISVQAPLVPQSTSRTAAQ
jgi:hypothetical protein